MYPVTLEDLGLKITIEKTLNLINKDYKYFVETDIEDVKTKSKFCRLRERHGYSYE